MQQVYDIADAVVCVLYVFLDEPPTASIEPHQQTVKQGSDVTVQCEITGLPTPTVHWSKVRSELGPNQRVCKYHIPKVVLFELSYSLVYFNRAPHLA